MERNSSRKLAFVTGGNRGIGYQTALQLGQAGAFVVVGARSDEQGRAAVRALDAAGVAAHWLKFDVTDTDDHQKVHDYFAARSGRLDILVNNAGVFLEGEPGVTDLFTAETVPEDVFRQTMEINFFAPVLLTQKLLPLLKAAPAGRIVNLSSILGSLALHRDPGSPIFGSHSVAYNTSKAAMNSYTIHLAKALEGTKVKVNAAHPGWVQTEMGGSAAPMPIADGARTSVLLATLPEDGPSGDFLHLGEQLPW